MLTARGARWRRRGGLLVLVAGLAGAPAPALAGAPAAYDIGATAAGLSVRSTQQPAASVVTAGLVDATVGYAGSALTSYGVSASRAAAAYPGDLVAGGPALLCSNVLPCPAPPPAYPLLADASYPARPAATAPGGPAGEAPGTARATAQPRATSATTAAAQAAVPPPVPVPLRVQTSTAATRAWVDARGAHATGSSTLHGLTVGPLRVGVIEAEATAEVGAKARPPVARLTVGEVTLAGQAASIDERGVHVAGTDRDLPARSLAAQGVSVRLVGADRATGPGAARAAAGGLLVTFTAAVRGAPGGVPGAPSADRTYLGSVLVGGAGVVVTTGAQPLAPLGLLGPAPPGSPAALVPPPAVPGLPPPQAVPAPPAGAAPAAGPVDQLLVRVASWLPLPDLQLVALALLVLPLSLLLLWRAAVLTGRRTGPGGQV